MNLNQLKRTTLMATLGLMGLGHAAWAQQPYRLPAQLEHYRFHLTTQSPTGQPTRWFTDTGGGLFLSAEQSQRLGLRSDSIEVDAGKKMVLATWAQLNTDANIPAPGQGPRKGILPVMALPAGQPQMPGMLGQAWFNGHAWRFDYGTGELWVNAALPKLPAHTIPLTFKPTPQGPLGFPRMTIVVAGDTLPVLFDTGATLFVSETSAPVYGNLPVGTEVATSFIMEDIFRKWQQQHPEWRVIENADHLMGRMGRNGPMIEVPQVTVAGHTVGPVWFALRPNPNFSQYMSGFMDAPVVGAVGGSLFRYFRITADYPAGKAVFEKL